MRTEGGFGQRGLVLRLVKSEEVNRGLGCQNGLGFRESRGLPWGGLWAKQELEVRIERKVLFGVPVGLRILSRVRRDALGCLASVGFRMKT